MFESALLHSFPLLDTDSDSDTLHALLLRLGLQYASVRLALSWTGITGCWHGVFAWLCAGTCTPQHPCSPTLSFKTPPTTIISIPGRMPLILRITKPREAGTFGTVAHAPVKSSSLHDMEL